MLNLSNKKGAEMSINTIIIIIMGVAVLVVLALGFSLGWDRLAPSLDSSNVQTIVTTCNTKCATGAKFDFCTSDISTELKDDKGNKIVTSCYALANIPFFEKYGIEKCSGINCQPEQECQLISLNINGEEYIGEIKATCDNIEDIDISDIARSLSSDAPDEKCCLVGAKTIIKD